jgi:hypothetical protein
MGRDGSPSRPHSARSENPPYPWQVLAVGGWEYSRSKGNRKPDSWLGRLGRDGSPSRPFADRDSAVVRVNGLGRDGSPSRPHSARSENPPYPWQENRFGWRVAAGVIPKGNRRPDDWRGCPFSGLGSRPSGTWFGRSGSGAGSGNLPSVICHRFRWRVAAPGGRWRVLSIQPSMQSSTQSSIIPLR